MTLSSKKELNKLQQELGKSVVVVPEDFCLFGHLSVKKNVALFLSRNSEGDSAEKESAELLSKAGMEQLCDKFPRFLSNLEKVELAILRGLVQAPDTLLIEDPFKKIEQEEVSVLTNFIDTLSNYSSSNVIVLN